MISMPHVHTRLVANRLQCVFALFFGSNDVSFTQRNVSKNSSVMQVFVKPLAVKSGSGNVLSLWLGLLFTGGEGHLGTE